MRAAVCTTIQEDERVEIVDDVTVADPGPGEVRIRIH